MTVPGGWGDTATRPQPAEDPETQCPMRDPQGRGPTPPPEAPLETGRGQPTSPPHPRAAGSGAAALVLSVQLSILNASLPLDLFLVSPSKILREKEKSSGEGLRSALYRGVNNSE